MIRLSIIYLLLVSLATPLNSGATAWMSLHMGAHGESRALPNDRVSTGHHASQYDAHRLAGHPDPTEPPLIIMIRRITDTTKQTVRPSA